MSKYHGSNVNNQTKDIIIVEELCKILFKELEVTRQLTGMALVYDLVDRGKITPNQARFLLNLPFHKQPEYYSKKEDI